MPSVTGATVDAIATAIGNRRIRGAVLISHVGRTSERDGLPQSADYLATLEGVETAVVFGVIGESTGGHQELASTSPTNPRSGGHPGNRSPAAGTIRSRAAEICRENGQEISTASWLGA